MRRFFHSAFATILIALASATAAIFGFFLVLQGIGELADSFGDGIEVVLVGITCLGIGFALARVLLPQTEGEKEEQNFGDFGGSAMLCAMDGRP